MVEIAVREETLKRSTKMRRESRPGFIHKYDNESLEWVDKVNVNSQQETDKADCIALTQREVKPEESGSQGTKKRQRGSSEPPY